MMLPGWNCASCLVFNGEEKEPLDTCRSCGSTRKTFGLPLESVMQYIRLIETNLANAQECGTRFHNRIVDLSAKLAEAERRNAELARERNEAQRIELAARAMRDEYRSTWENEYARGAIPGALPDSAKRTTH